MASNFPSSLDSFTNPSSSDAMDSVSVPHATQHSDLNDAVEALQAKVGADSSAVSSSHDYKIAQLEAISHGKILQVVRATDTTERTTTSTSMVDANISVTITPTSASSNIILIWTHRLNSEVNAAGFVTSATQITDSSNNVISGAFGPMTTRNFTTTGTPELRTYEIRIGYHSPATTSATTYKGRFAAGVAGQTSKLKNNEVDGQMFALEISA